VELGDVGRVYIVASMFGRVDHTLATISSLFDPQYQGLELVLVDQSNISLPVFAGNTIIDLPNGCARCGLIPIERSVVTTTGLKWNLTEQVMELGGLISSSNELTANQVTITSSGKLLWTASIA
jgi:thiamine pyrophosphokinase